MSKLFDYAFPVTGAAGGSLLAIPVLETAITAFVFAFVGGIVGYLVKKLLDWIFKKFKDEND